MQHKSLDERGNPGLRAGAHLSQMTGAAQAVSGAGEVAG
jgi:hypothetical protein